MALDRPYKIEILVYQKSDRVPSNCNAITFWNIGAVTCIINNQLPLAAGAQITIGGNNNEIDTTEYFINFGSLTTGVVAVIRKINQ